MATSDPANLQALEEVRFKTNLIVEPVVVEDDKLGQMIQRLAESSVVTLNDTATMEDLEIAIEEGQGGAIHRGGELARSRTPPSSATSRRS